MQFTISIVLIIGTIIVAQQVRFMQSKTLGLDKDQVVIVENAGTLSDADKDAFRNAAFQINGVKKIAMSDGIVGGQNWTKGLHVQESQNFQPVNFLSVSDDYIEALGIQLKEGRIFSAKYPTDVKSNLPGESNKLTGSIILNETAVEALGIKEPVVGKIFIGMKTI